MEIIDEVIRNLAWEKACKTEIVIKTLKDIGINPINCFFDEKGNLVIPINEIQNSIHIKNN